MKILIVEDDGSLRDLMQMYLSEYGSCDLVANGKEAVEAVEHGINSGQPYDLACMDVMMPEMDGMEALKKIRQLEFKHFKNGIKSMKVIMITAKDTAKDMVSAYDSGAEAYITKPFNLEQLNERMRELGLFDKPAEEPDTENTDLPL